MNTQRYWLKGQNPGSLVPNSWRNEHWINKVQSGVDRGGSGGKRNRSKEPLLAWCESLCRGQQHTAVSGRRWGSGNGNPSLPFSLLRLCSEIPGGENESASQRGKWKCNVSSQYLLGMRERWTQVKLNLNHSGSEMVMHIMYKRTHTCVHTALVSHEEPEWFLSVKHRCQQPSVSRETPQSRLTTGYLESLTLLNRF